MPLNPRFEAPDLSPPSQRARTGASVNAEKQSEPFTEPITEPITEESK